MRKIILFIILIFTFIFTGCADKAETSSEYIKETDAQYMYMRTDGERYITAGEDGYYFINGRYIYYSDYEIMEPVVLCNKANCLHDKETDPTKKYKCNGFVLVEHRPLLLTVNEDYLYCHIESDFTKDVMSEPELIRISLDGTTRETITTLEANIISMSLHRDKLYYSVAKPYIDEDTSIDDGIYEYAIKELDIKDAKAEPKEILSGSGVDAGVDTIIPIGNKLMYFQYEAENGRYIGENYVIDFTNNKIETIGADLNIKSTGSISILGNKVLIMDRNNDEESYIYEYDLEKNESSKLFELKQEDRLFYSDDKYIYADNTNWFSDSSENVEKRTLTVYDKNGDIIDVIDISEIEDGFLFNGGDDRYLFIKGQYIEDGNIEGEYIKYIDKEEIGSGNVQLKTFFELEGKYLDTSISR